MDNKTIETLKNSRVGSLLAMPDGGFIDVVRADKYETDNDGDCIGCVFLRGFDCTTRPCEACNRQDKENVKFVRAKNTVERQKQDVTLKTMAEITNMASVNSAFVIDGKGMRFNRLDFDKVLFEMMQDLQALGKVDQWNPLDD